VTAPARSLEPIREDHAMTDEAGAQPPRFNFYGRRSGRTLRPAQRSYLDEDLPRLALPPGPVDLGARFGARPVWLEIGFGGGEHLAALAAANPEVGFIGVEPFVNGVAMLLGRLRAAPVANIALHPGDVRDLLPRMAPASVARVFLNYPDPWPKARHHRRRFVTPEYLGPLARVTAPGALFHIATDIPDYARQAREEVPRAGFAPVADGPEPWDGWVRTRYEAKALREGRTPLYLTFRRL
jgi:tRNA (guanine-N7-)-methyltransferase